MGRHIAEKIHNNVNVETHASKMRKNYSLLRNLDVPNTTKEKREAVKNHMLPMKNKINEFNNILIQSLVCSFY